MVVMGVILMKKVMIDSSILKAMKIVKVKRIVLA